MKPLLSLAVALGFAQAATAQVNVQVGRGYPVYVHSSCIFGHRHAIEKIEQMLQVHDRYLNDHEQRIRALEKAANITPVAPNGQLPPISQNFYGVTPGMGQFAQPQIMAPQPIYAPAPAVAPVAAPVVAPAATPAPYVVYPPIVVSHPIVTPPFSSIGGTAPSTTAPSSTAPSTTAPSFVPGATGGVVPSVPSLVGGGAPSFVPSATGAPSFVPSATGAPSFVPSATGAPSFVPSATGAPAFSPSATGLPGAASQPTTNPTAPPIPTPTMPPAVTAAPGVPFSPGAAGAPGVQSNVRPPNGYVTYSYWPVRQVYHR